MIPKYLFEPLSPKELIKFILCKVELSFSSIISFYLMTSTFQFVMLPSLYLHAINPNLKSNLKHQSLHYLYESLSLVSKYIYIYIYVCFFFFWMRYVCYYVIEMWKSFLPSSFLFINNSYWFEKWAMILTLKMSILFLRTKKCPILG